MLCQEHHRPAAAMADSRAGYTFVLQHGAWHGGWCWVRVADRLVEQGHRVIAPTSTGLGERSHLIATNVTVDVFVTDLVNVLETQELEDVVLVGHSFGGITVSGAADRVPKRIRKLVFLDAVILQPGTSVLSSIPPNVAAERRKAIQDAGGVAIPSPPPSFFGVTDEADAAWMKARLTPHPAATYDSLLNIRNPVGAGLPTTYISCTRNALASIEPMRKWARERADWTHQELDAVHNVMMTEPGALTQRLLEIAAS